jgi:hypothetical protein
MSDNRLTHIRQIIASGLPDDLARRTVEIYLDSLEFCPESNVRRSECMEPPMKLTAYIQRSSPTWELSDGAMRQLAEQAVGMPVTVEFDPGRSVGRVAEAEVEADRVRLELAVPEELAPEIAEWMHLDDLNYGFVAQQAEDLPHCRRRLDAGTFHEISIPRPPARRSSGE